MKSVPGIQPPDAQFKFASSYFKFGVHKKLFRWDGSEWMLTTNKPETVLREGVALTYEARMMQELKD